MDTTNEANRLRALCRLDQIPDGEAVAVDAMVDGEPESVIVWRRGEMARAWVNICPHAGRPLDWAPGKFLISRDTLICAAHGASFRTDDGVCIGGPCRGARLRGVAITVESGVVFAAP